MTASLGVLAPGMLIAAPPLGDPNFDRTVVLLAAHGADGALGFVINRAAPIKLGELLARAGYKDTGVASGAPVFIGGPVQPSSGWIVGLFEEHAEPDAPGEDGGLIRVGDRVCVSSSRRAFDAFARDVEARTKADADPRKRMIMLGYSGWGAGQLEREIAAGAWLPVPLDEGVLFEGALDTKWERAYALLGVLPAGMMASHFVGEA